MLRRRLEHAGAGGARRGADHAARTRLRAGRAAHALSDQAAAARAVHAADHHAALRHRPGADPAVRPLGHDHAWAQRPVRHPAQPLDLRRARAHHRAVPCLHADRIAGAAGRAAGRQPEPGGSIADPARRALAHLPQRHLAADPPRPRQRVPDRLHREHGRFRQSARDRRQFQRAVHRHLLRRGRRVARPGPRRGAGHRAAGLHADGLRRAAVLARPAQLRDAWPARVDAGIPAPLPGGLRVACYGVVVPWLAAHRRGLRHDPGRRLRRLDRPRQHADAGVFLDRLRDREGRRRLVPGRLRLEFVHRHDRGRADRHAVHGGARDPYRLAARPPAISPAAAPSNSSR